MVLGQLDFKCKRMKVGPFFTTHTKIHSKWMKDISAKTIKRFKKTEVNPHDLEFGNGFLDITSKGQATQENNLDIIKI